MEMYQAGVMALWLRALAPIPEKFNPLDPDGGAQLFLTPVPGYPFFSFVINICLFIYLYGRSETQF